MQGYRHHTTVYLFFLRPCPPPRSPLFPYTTLFRSQVLRVLESDDPGKGDVEPQVQRGARDFGGFGEAVEDAADGQAAAALARSEEHTSELQSHHDLVCRLLLEKKKHKHT